MNRIPPSEPLFWGNRRMAGTLDAAVLPGVRIITSFAPGRPVDYEDAAQAAHADGFPHRAEAFAAVARKLGWLPRHVRQRRGLE